MTNRFWALGLLAAALVLSACSSVTRGSLALGAGGNGAGSSSGAAVSGSSNAGSGSSAGVGSGSGAIGSGSSGPALSGGNGAGAGAVAGSLSSGSVVSGGGGGEGPAAASSGATHCVVRVGVSYSSDEAEGFAAVGHPQTATNFANYTKTLKAGYQIGIDDLNRHGGVGGCQSQVVYHDFSSLASDGFDGESQKECTDFAQDQHAFVAFPAALEDRVLMQCLSQQHVPVFWNVTTYNPTEADFSRYRGYLYQINQIAPDRWSPFIGDLAKAGYFDPGSNVGILVADNGTGNNQRLVNQMWKPQIQAMHIPVTTFTYSQIDSFSSVSDTSSQFGSAVLQFRAAGVNHVIFTPDGGDGLIFFTAAAESQHYTPRYGMTSSSAPAGMTTAPADQASRSMAVSWTPTDFLNLNDPGAPIPGLGSTPVRDHCNGLYSSFASANGEPVADFYPWCDLLSVLQTALSKTSNPTVASLESGMGSLVSGTNPANGYAPVQLGPGRSDGGTAIRVIVWNDASKGFTFASGPEAVP